MRHLARAAMSVAAVVALTACGGGDTPAVPDASEPIGGETSDDASEPQAPGETSEPGGFPTGLTSTGTYTQGSFTGTVTGDLTVDLDVPLTPGLTGFIPGVPGINPNVAIAQFGGFETTYVLVSATDGEGEQAAASFTLVHSSAGFADDGSEGQCAIDVSQLSAESVAGTVTCTGLVSDDGEQTIDVQGSFTASK